jgi:hypothetical protein
VARFFQYMQPVSTIFRFFKLHFMKNTTNQEPTYSLLPALRVAFKNEEIVEEKSSQPANPKKREKKKVEPSKPNLPLFDDYRIKAKDHDPL